MWYRSKPNTAVSQYFGQLMAAPPSVPLQGRLWPRINVLGVGVSTTSMAQTLSIIEQWIEVGAQHYLCACTVYTVLECQRDAQLRRQINRASLTIPDGMPLVWLAHLCGYHHVERVYGPDLLLALAARGVERGYRHFFYGGAPGVATRLAEVLMNRLPGLSVVGTLSPPFRPLSPLEDADVVAQINASRPDLVWVGLGTPRQDRWVAEHVGRIQAPALIPIGAAFDFIAGRVRQAPRWMQRRGLEWLFRLSQEPRRLWRRYLIGNPMFIALLCLQWSGLRRLHIEE
jgi:N-acetylglucosaminyldiphosphoundecaprenol N-acetyl-beta-D-mannosaminyltransferase